ncbi:unnamed protein product [Caenorhabditis nigoni]
MPPKLDEACRKDPRIRATFVLYKFQSEKSIFESYKSFCRKMGSNFMDYSEFEFWWQRFSAGNFDIDYDRSKEPKYCTITDLPVHIFEKICDNLGEDYKKEYWFTLRHVCKSFRGIVGSWKAPKFEEIEIRCGKESISLNFDGYVIEYFKKSKNSSKIKVHNSAEVSYSGNFRDLAIDDLMSVLASPGGYKLQHLTIFEKIDKIFVLKLCDKFENLAANVDVDTVELHPTRNMNPILVNKFLNLFRSIKKIDIKGEDKKRLQYTQKYFETIVDKINGIEALKGPMVHIDSFLTMVDRELVIPRGLKIPEMTLYLEDSSDVKFRRFGWHSPTAVAPNIVQILLKSHHLKFCRINATSFLTRVNIDKKLKELGAENYPETPDLYKYQIPDSDDYFEIEIKRNDRAITDVYIRRKSSSA